MEVHNVHFPEQRFFARFGREVFENSDFTGPTGLYSLFRNGYHGIIHNIQSEDFYEEVSFPQNVETFMEECPGVLRKIEKTLIQDYDELPRMQITRVMRIRVTDNHNHDNNNEEDEDEDNEERTRYVIFGRCEPSYSFAFKYKYDYIAYIAPHDPRYQTHRWAKRLGNIIFSFLCGCKCGPRIVYECSHCMKVLKQIQHKKYRNQPIQNFQRKLKHPKSRKMEHVDRTFDGTLIGESQANAFGRNEINRRKTNDTLHYLNYSSTIITVDIYNTIAPRTSPLFAEFDLDTNHQETNFMNPLAAVATVFGGLYSTNPNQTINQNDDIGGIGDNDDEEDEDFTLEDHDDDEEDEDDEDFTLEDHADHEDGEQDRDNEDFNEVFHILNGEQQNQQQTPEREQQTREMISREGGWVNGGVVGRTRRGRAIRRPPHFTPPELRRNM